MACGDPGSRPSAPLLRKRAFVPSRSFHIKLATTVWCARLHRRSCSLVRSTGATWRTLVCRAKWLGKKGDHRGTRGQRCIIHRACRGHGAGAAAAKCAPLWAAWGPSTWKKRGALPQAAQYTAATPRGTWDALHAQTRAGRDDVSPCGHGSVLSRYDHCTR